MPTITVKGMSCEHCKQAVTRALEAIPGVGAVTVDLATGAASWTETQPVAYSVIENVIKKIGFEVQ
ncbi:MAG: cation transporter [Bilophila sp.]